MEVGLGGVGVAVAEAVFQELAGEGGEFEGFEEALFGGHGAEDGEVALVVGAWLGVHGQSRMVAGSIPWERMKSA